MSKKKNFIDSRFIPFLTELHFVDFMNALYSVEFVVTRQSSEEPTFGVVRAKVNEESLREEGPFLAALKDAVTRWVRTSEEGKLQWEKSSEDFNLGDLSLQDMRSPHLTDKGSELGRALADVGIFSLHIEVHSQDKNCRFWTYDTILVDKLGYRRKPAKKEIKDVGN